MNTGVIAIVVASHHHGNTRKVAETIAQALDADLMSAETAEPHQLARYDLIGLGTGIYFGMPHRSLRRLVGALPRAEKDVFLFSTAGLSFLRPLWHWGLRRVLAKKGYRVIGEFSCPGWDTVGPLKLIGGLNRGRPSHFDLDRALAFAESVKSRSSPTHCGQVESDNPGKPRRSAD